MPEPSSTHLPGIAGALERVTGEIVVNTGLRSIRTFVATFQTQNFIPGEESILSWYFPDPLAEPGKVVIRVEKGGANHGLLGDSEVVVSWLALGD